MHVVHSGTLISLFLTTVIQLLLFAKHRVGVIVMSHRPIYRQTADIHNKFPEKKSPNIEFPENSCDVIGVILRLAVLIEHRPVIVTDTRRQHIPRDAKSKAS